MFERWRKTEIPLKSWRMHRGDAETADPAQVSLVWMIALGFAAVLLLMMGLTLAVWLALGPQPPHRDQGLLALLGVLALGGLLTPPLLAWVLIRRVQKLGAVATSQINESLAESLQSDDALDTAAPDPLASAPAGFEDLTEVIHRLHGLDGPTGASTESVLAEPSAAVTSLARRCLEVSTEVAILQGRAHQSRLRMAQTMDRIEGLTFQTVSLALQSGLQGRPQPATPAEPDEIRQLARRALEAARDIQRLVEPAAPQGERLRLAADLDRLLESMAQPADEPVLRQLEQLNRQLGQQVVQAAQEAQSQEQQAERLDKVISAFELLVQTQQATWQARHIIASVRDRAARDCG